MVPNSALKRIGHILLLIGCIPLIHSCPSQLLNDIWGYLLDWGQLPRFRGSSNLLVFLRRILSSKRCSSYLLSCCFLSLFIWGCVIVCWQYPFFIPVSVINLSSLLNLSSIRGLVPPRESWSGMHLSYVSLYSWMYLRLSFCSASIDSTAIGKKQIHSL